MASKASVDTLAIFARPKAPRKCLLGSLPKPGIVGASSISRAPPFAAGLAHSAAPPLPAQPAVLGLRGDPAMGQSVP